MSQIDSAEILDLCAGGVMTDGGHHKNWYLDQIARLILDDRYDEWVRAVTYGEDGPDTYEYDPGIAP